MCILVHKKYIDQLREYVHSYNYVYTSIPFQNKIISTPLHGQYHDVMLLK